MNWKAIMDEEKINKMLDDLFSKKITKSTRSIGDFETDIIAKEGRVIVEQIIREYLLENRDETISVPRAKVFAYEKIISNSNFAPILEGNKAT